VGPAARALACRGRTGAFEALLRAWRAGEGASQGSTGIGDIIGALVGLSQQGTPEQRRELAEALRARLQQTNGLLSDVILAIWAADLRQLAPDLARVARHRPMTSKAIRRTAGAAARPDRRGSLPRGEEGARPVNEEDALTRARLLVAFGRFEPALATRERAEQMKRALAESVRALAKSPTERERLRHFVERVASGAGGGDPAWPSTRRPRRPRP